MNDKLKTFRKNLKNRNNFIAGLACLQDVEKIILIESYCKGVRCGATHRLAETLNYSESTIKRIRRHALVKIYEVLKDGA